jgi:hypothetical protein
LKPQSRNLEIGIEMKFDGVMNGLSNRSFFRSKTIGDLRTNPPAVRCISSLLYEDAASIRAKNDYSFFKRINAKNSVRLPFLFLLNVFM